MTNLMLQVLFHNAAICKLTPRKSVPALYGKQKQFLLVDVYEVSVFKDYYGVLSLIEFRSRTDQNSKFFLHQSKVPVQRTRQLCIQIQIQILGQSRRLVGPRPILALPIYHSFVPGLTVACSEG